MTKGTRFSASTAALAAFMAFGVQFASAQEVYINSSGGTLDDINRQIHWDPFTAATGIKVINSAPVDQAKLKAMVTNGNAEWDITEIDSGDFPLSIKEGLLEKLDLKQLPVDQLPKEAVSEYGVWDGPYSTILTWNTDVFPLSGKHPTSLMDLWNQEDFPGPRCLYNNAFDNLELGALHAGVPRDKIYPIDQDLAYKELDKLKKDVSVWWTSGAQSVQSVISKDCVMGTTWNGRPYQLIIKDKAPLGVAWDGAVLRTSWWAIPKGAKNFDNAMKLLAWMQDPQRQADQAKLSGYAGGNKGTEALLPDEVKEFLATSPQHLEKSIVADDTWWEENGPAAQKRFTGWVIAQ